MYKSLKKLLAVALCAAMIGGTAAMLPAIAPNSSVTASAAETYGNFEYELNDDNTVTITKYSGSDAQVTIPSKIDGKSVTEIGDMAFHENTGLTSINVASGNQVYTSYDGMLLYGTNCLIYCPGTKTSITVPDRVKYFGYNPLVIVPHLKV